MEKEKRNIKERGDVENGCLGNNVCMRNAEGATQIDRHTIDTQPAAIWSSATTRGTTPAPTPAAQVAQDDKKHNREPRQTALCGKMARHRHR